MKIHEVAQKTGVSVRTLQYYDQIGLLPPAEITPAGYRIYDDGNLMNLQEILFFRELHFPLGDIREIMENPGYDKTEALRKHRELLLQKRTRLDGLLTLLDATIGGETTMNFSAFDTSRIEETRKQYASEVKARWGKTNAYRESGEKTAGYDAKQWEAIGGEGTVLLQAFGKLRDGDPASLEAQELVACWQDYITQHFYHCTKEILFGLGQMYSGDERFTANIDQNGSGTAAFLAKAIEVYCARV